MNKTFVLIHGTWHGGWAWNEVVRALSERGHRAHAPTLPGHGPGVTRRGIAHGDCVEAVVTYLQEHELKDVILVGHSFGGSVVQKVAERLPEKIAHVIFLDALLLNDKECVFDILPDTFLDSLTSKNRTDPAVASPESTIDVFPPPPWETWRDNFIQDAPESLARWTWERLSPEPNQVNLDRVDLKRFCSLTVPKSLIHCRQDKAMPPGYFHPRMSSRLGAFKLLEMDGSHEVMFTRPTELAEKIIEASLDSGMIEQERGTFQNATVEKL
jgi:pimeloyl-ACP methyl ester carboxylesterase